MIERSKQAGVKSMIVTCGSLRESGSVLGVAKDYSEYFWLAHGCTDNESVPRKISMQRWAVTQLALRILTNSTVDLKRI